MNRIEKLVECERQAHLNFFGKEFDLTNFKTTLEKYGENKVKEWEKLLLEPHFLPRVEMSRKANFPGWKVRPTDHHYETVYQGRVLRNINDQIMPDKKAYWLLGEMVLIDTRLKPAYQNGEQMWNNDDNFLGPILENLRKFEKIAKYGYGSQSSRFGVSADEWEGHIKPTLNESTGLNWRFERAVEGHIIPQLYTNIPRKDDGTTKTFVWYEEYFEDMSYRLYGGRSDYGGLSDFRWDWLDFPWYGRSFRPLAVL